MSNEKYYIRLGERKEKLNNAVVKARARGEAAKAWFAKGNILTKETLAEFNALMKSVDKQSKNIEP